MKSAYELFGFKKQLLPTKKMGTKWERRGRERAMIPGNLHALPATPTGRTHCRMRADECHRARAAATAGKSVGIVSSESLARVVRGLFYTIANRGNLGPPFWPREWLARAELSWEGRFGLSRLDRPMWYSRPVQAMRQA